MILNYQDRQKLNPPIIPVYHNAIVAAVNGNTATLRFSDGGTSQKYYESLIPIAVGNRVSIVKQSGTYIITGVL